MSVSAGHTVCAMCWKRVPFGVRERLLAPALRAHAPDAEALTAEVARAYRDLSDDQRAALTQAVQVGGYRVVYEAAAVDPVLRRLAALDALPHEGEPYFIPREAVLDRIARRGARIDRVIRARRMGKAGER